MNNPFKYGEVVTGNTFTNRTREIKEITACIHSAQNMFIYGPRRQGKTSLVTTIINRLGDDVISIYVDVQRAASLSQFIEVYAEAVTRPLLKNQTNMSRLGSFFRHITPSIELSPTGGVKASFSFSHTSDSISIALEEAMNLPQKIADDMGKRVLVVLDEFQDISELNGGSTEQVLRSFIQHHQDVCYIFMGSKTHIIMDMFSNPSRAFYNSAKIYPLPEMSKQSLAKYIVKQFEHTHKSIAMNLAETIVFMSYNSPYHIQLFCHTLWQHCKKAVTEKDLEVTLINILHMQNELYYCWYDSLTMIQRSVLITLSQTKEIFSKDIKIQYSLGSNSTIQTALGALQRKGLVDKREGSYMIQDPFLRIWIKKEVLNIEATHIAST